MYAVLRGRGGRGGRGGAGGGGGGGVEGGEGRRLPTRAVAAVSPQ